MKYIAYRLGLWLCKMGIMIYESQPFGMLAPKDKENLRELWKLYDNFSRKVA